MSMPTYICLNRFTYAFISTYAYAYASQRYSMYACTCVYLHTCTYTRVYMYMVLLCVVQCTWTVVMLWSHPFVSRLVWTCRALHAWYVVSMLCFVGSWHPTSLLSSNTANGSSLITTYFQMVRLIRIALAVFNVSSHLWLLVRLFHRRLCSRRWGSLSLPGTQLRLLHCGELWRWHMCRFRKW